MGHRSHSWQRLLWLRLVWWGSAGWRSGRSDRSGSSWPGSSHRPPGSDQPHTWRRSSSRPHHPRSPGSHHSHAGRPRRPRTSHSRPAPATTSRGGCRPREGRSGELGGMGHDQAAHGNTDRTRGGDPDDSWACQLWRLQSVEDESLWLAARAARSPDNVGRQCRALNRGEVGGGETGGYLDQLSRSGQGGHTADLRVAISFGVQLAWFEDLY